MLRASRPRAAIASVALFAATASLDPAQAHELDEAKTWCYASEADGVSLDLRISGCTTVILSGTLSNSDLARAYTNRGNAYRAKGQHDDAIQDFDQAIKLDPSDADFFYERSLVRAKKGDKKGADADRAAARRFSSNTRALSQLPPIVAQQVADFTRSCPNVRLDEILYQVALSGPGTRDYVIDMRKAPLRCGVCGASGSGVCGFSVLLNPTPGRWVDAGVGEFEIRGGWYTVRRRSRTLLVIKHSCDVTRKDVCATLYRASRDKLVKIDEALACLSSAARQQKGPAKQPKHEGHCAATAYFDYRHCRQKCGQPFTKRR